MEDKIKTLTEALAKARQMLDEKKTELEAKRNMWESEPENAALIARVQELSTAVSTFDETLRAEVVKHFTETGEKKALEGVEVKVYEELTYDVNAVTAWCFMHQPELLTVNFKEYEKLWKRKEKDSTFAVHLGNYQDIMRSVLGNGYDAGFSTMPGEKVFVPKPNIAKDLSQYLTDGDGYPSTEPKPETITVSESVAGAIKAGYFDGSLMTSREKVVAWAQDLLQSEDFVIIDTETTGFGDDDEIIQIAVIDHNGNELLNTLVKPTKSITNTDYHGITDETVKDAPTFPEVYKQLEAVLRGKNVLAYNYAYDSRMVAQNCERHYREPILHAASGLNAVVHCVMEQYARYYGDWNGRKGSYTWQKLRDALDRFGLSHCDFGDKEHDAATDAKATLAVLKKMAENADVLSF